MNKPLITEFVGDGFNNDKEYRLANIELFNYIDALDKYIDELLISFEDTHELYKASLKRGYYFTHDITRVMMNEKLLDDDRT